MTNVGNTSFYGRDDTFTTQRAGPHYFSERQVIEEGKKVPVISWGTLRLTEDLRSGEPIECENTVGGFVENPVGGGPGKAETNGWAAYNCKNLQNAKRREGTSRF